ncbi:MAG: N-acetyltransferase [Bacteroidetes bacterium]|nr:MAG: N-acetyltransferase [Bacteroidota bacterium]
MEIQPILEDDLIRMRPLEAADFELLYAVAKDPLIWEQHPCWDRYKKAVFAEFFEDSMQSGGALVILDKATDTIIGSSRFKPVAGVKTAVEIGWSFLARQYWGGKYNGASKRLMLAHAFESVEDVVFYIGKENIRSQKAVKKIGGKCITDVRLKYLIKDSPSDWTFRISKTNWVQ